MSAPPPPLPPPPPPDKRRIARTTSRESDASSGRRVSFAAQAQVKKHHSNDDGDQVHKNNSLGGNSTTTNVPLKLFDGATPRSYTPETFSDASSATGSSGLYEVIEYDPSKQIMSFNLNRPKKQPQQQSAPTSAAALQNAWDGIESDDENLVEAEAPFEIEDNTPAAEALRASASVRVSRMGKVARAVHMQAVRRLVKRATLTGKQGVVKGQPERLPPRQLQEGEVKPEELSDLEEENEEEEDDEDYVEHQEEEATEKGPPHGDNEPSHNSMSAHHYYGEPVVPDDVVQGTAEAGKKGKFLFLSFPTTTTDDVIHGYYSQVVQVTWYLTVCIRLLILSGSMQSSVPLILTICSNFSDGERRKRVR